MTDNKKLTSEEIKRLSYLQYISNFNKIDEEFEESCHLTKLAGLSTPNRNSKERPSQEKNH